MVLITFETIEKICHKGKIPYAYTVHGNATSVRQVYDLSKTLDLINTSGIGIVPSMYSTGMISNNPKLDDIFAKTFNLLDPYDLPEIKNMVNDISSQNLISMRSIKLCLFKLNNIVTTKINNLVQGKPSSYHIKVVNNRIKLLGVMNGQKYCDVNGRISKAIRPTYVLKISDIKLVYDNPFDFETDLPYSIVTRKEETAIIRPVFKNTWLSKGNNQMVVDYLFDQLILHDYDNLLNPYDIKGFRLFMQKINKPHL